MEEIRIPEAFQSVINLGPARKVHRVGWFTAGASISGMAAVAIIILLMLAFAVITPFVSEDNNTKIFAPLCLGAGGLAAGIYFWSQLRHTLRTLRTTVVLYDGGFAVSQGKDEPTICTWEDIRHLSAEITQHTVYGIIPAGKECKFTIGGEKMGTVVLRSPLGGVEKLYQDIHEKVMPRIAAALLTQFQEGRTVEFGPISVSRAGGIQMKNRTLGWNDIRNIQAANGFLMIHRKSGGLLGALSFAMGAIPNLDALLLICQEAAKTQTG